MALGRLWSVALVAAAALSGCTAGPTGTDTAAPTTAPTSAAATQGVPSPVVSSPSAAVPDTLRFTATTVDGAPFDAATLSGKPVVLWFWAAWCPRCRAAADDIAAVQREYAGTVHVVGVAGLGSGQAQMKKFIADTGIGGFPNLSDDAGRVWQRFGIATQEYFVIIDKSGRIVHKGLLSPAELRAKVSALAG